MTCDANHPPTISSKYTCKLYKSYRRKKTSKEKKKFNVDHNDWRVKDICTLSEVGGFDAGKAVADKVAEWRREKK